MLSKVINCVYVIVGGCSRKDIWILFMHPLYRCTYFAHAFWCTSTSTIITRAITHDIITFVNCHCSCKVAWFTDYISFIIYSLSFAWILFKSIFVHDFNVFIHNFIDCILLKPVTFIFALSVFFGPLRLIVVKYRISWFSFFFFNCICLDTGVLYFEMVKWLHSPADEF